MKKSNQMVQKRHKFFKNQVLPPIYQRNFIKEQEKRIELSESDCKSIKSNKPQSEINEDNSSIDINYRNKYSHRMRNMNNKLVEEEKQSEYQSRQSFLDTNKEKQSIGAFQYHNKLFRGLEQSEIQNINNADSEVTSTIFCALNQVTKLVNAHDLKFYNMRKEESEESCDSLPDQDIFTSDHNLKPYRFKSDPKETKLFQVLNHQTELSQTPRVIDIKTITERKAKSKEKRKGHSSQLSNPLFKYKNEAIENDLSECKKIDSIEIDTINLIKSPLF